MGPASRAGIGAVSSLAFHAAAGVGLAAMLTTRDVPEQAAPKSRIELATATLERKNAVPQDAGGRATPDVAPADRTAIGGVIRRQEARSEELDARRATEADVGKTVATSISDSRFVGGTTPEARPVTSPSSDKTVAQAAAIQIQQAEAVQGSQQHVVANPMDAATAVPLVPKSQRSQTLTGGLMPSVSLASELTKSSIAPPVEVRRKSARSSTPDSRRATNSEIESIARPVPVNAPRPVTLSASSPDASLVLAALAMAPAAPETDSAGERPPPLDVEAQEVRPSQATGETVAAKMAFSGGAQLSLDSLGLLAVTAFVAPEVAGAEGQELRDGIGQVLSSVPCSRLQTAFDSSTGVLELRGHVPDEAIRATLTSALQGQIGDVLPVVDRLHVLKEPQCGILGQLDALGVPQSEEQFTDPGLIGDNLFVREYGFAQGDRMVIELEAADYPAFVYVDYFDADGNVLHLMPNAVLPLRRYAPSEPFAIGAAASGLDLIVEPPFGQDIAVALASDRALYDGLRPLAEPAGDYLEFLRSRIAEVAPERAEWVYLLVKTGPGP